MATERQRRGAVAEDTALAYLRGMGWTAVARNVRIGRDEIDLVAVDKGPPLELVFVEVRSATSRRFGEPEERVDRGKVGHLYRAMSAVTAAGLVPVELR
ncbi:MAG TPA: YraN family protein, partial [Candidatus Limnocylindrales bacterium]|nr:YraN family protein [Candidatus Limnocylindrales bacterium]